MNQTSISFQVGCSGPIEDVPWTVAREVVFDELCGAPPLRLPSAGGGVCSSPPVRRFVIYFRDQPTPVLADAISLSSDGVLHYDDQATLKQGHGPISGVRGIARRRICQDQSERLEVPKTFCVEDSKFAANFSYETPVANRILTRGFSFFLETVPVAPERRSELQQLVGSGFGTALNIWISEVWRRKGEADPRLAKLFEGMVSRSPQNYVMFLPPQVVALDCPHNATFTVRVQLGRGAPFLESDAGIKAAYAAKPGRTVLLNFVDYPCWRHAYFAFVLEKETGCLNIVPIMMHELGHAFGLGHAEEDGSIMAEVVHQAHPSTEDIDRLADQLLRSVEGQRPGVIEFVADNGVAVE